MKAAYLSWVIFFLLLTRSFCCVAVSMGDLMGQVIDLQTGKGVPYAEIVFENNFDRITAIANERGFYYASHIPEGRYQMRVCYNHRIFFMNHVKVYDSYADEVNFIVSDDECLPEVVQELRPEPVIHALQPNDIILTSSILNPGTQ